MFFFFFENIFDDETKHVFHFPGAKFDIKYEHCQDVDFYSSYELWELKAKNFLKILFLYFCIMLPI